MVRLGCSCHLRFTTEICKSSCFLSERNSTGLSIMKEVCSTCVIKLRKNCCIFHSSSDAYLFESIKLHNKCISSSYYNLYPTFYSISHNDTLKIA